MIRVTIQGAAGRMGRMLVAQVAANADMKLVGATEQGICPLLGQDAGIVAGVGALDVPLTTDLEGCLAQSDAIIAFTAPDATMDMARKAAARNVAMVIGTTGLTATQKEELAALATQGARIVFAPNMSVGVNLLFALCNQVARILGDDYDIEDRKSVV